MAKNHREKPFRVSPRAGELICVAHTAGLDFNQDLAGLRALQIHLDHFQRLARGVCNSSFRFHATLVSTARAGTGPTRGERQSLPVDYLKLIMPTAPRTCR